MTLFLRQQNAQDVLEGREPKGWKPDDYAVVDDRVIGRIYSEQIHGETKWLWFLQTTPSPSRGMADSLDQAKAEIAAAYKRQP